MTNNNRCSRFQFFAAAFLLSIVTSANAALIDRGGGLIYDDDRNITWLADGNYVMTSGYDADGLITWSDAVSWAEGLSYGGYYNWRLPNADADCGVSFNCGNSELGHLFYNELSGTSGSSILTSSDPDLGLFSNIQSNWYWTGTERNSSEAWFFDFSGGGGGGQSIGSKGSILMAWAVHDGDIAAVPIPAAFWLFGSGLVGLIGFMRRCSNKIKH